MNAEIVAIGTELLLGFVVNSDTAYLGRVLAGLGISCYRQVTVGDNPARLAEGLRTALARADLVITCGGLGPTVDDITLETIASVTAKRLRLNRSVRTQIERRFRRIGVRMPKANLRQALIPEGATVLPNQVGTAPGFLLTLLTGDAPFWDTPLRSVPSVSQMERPQFLVALPGPPQELIPMVEKHLIPYLKRFTGKRVIHSKTLKLAGVTESEVDAKVRDLLALKGAVTVGIYAHPGQVDLRITAKADSGRSADRRITQVERKIRRRLGNLIFGADEETLEGVAGQLLRQRKLTLSVAESITGGLLGHRITEVPGSSDYFRGGLIAYANELKISPLGVSPDLLKRHGAVSAPVAQAMALGIRRLTGSDLGIGITGIAGPTGGTPKKPVGLVFVTLATPKGIKTYRQTFSGDRSTVKFKATQSALNLLRQYLHDPGLHRG